MQKINSESDLKAAIIYLENRQNEERNALRQKFNLAYESINPVNIIKHTLKGAARSSGIKENLLVTAVGISAGFLAKKYTGNNSRSPFIKLLGPALVVGVPHLVATHPEAVKRMGRSVLNVLRGILGIRRHEAIEDIPAESKYLTGWNSSYQEGSGKLK